MAAAVGATTVVTLDPGFWGDAPDYTPASLPARAAAAADGPEQLPEWATPMDALGTVLVPPEARRPGPVLPGPAEEASAAVTLPLPPYQPEPAPSSRPVSSRSPSRPRWGTPPPSSSAPTGWSGGSRSVRSGVCRSGGAGGSGTRS